MKRTLFIVLIFCLGLTGLANTEGKTKINIILKTQSDATELARTASIFPNKDARRDFVVSTLKHQAETSQCELMSFLKELENNGLVEEIRPLWIVNSISCYADESVFHAIEMRNDILMVYPCEQSPLMDESQAIQTDRGSREIAEHLLQVNADKVWELGYTGEDILIAIMLTWQGVFGMVATRIRTTVTILPTMTMTPPTKTDMALMSLELFVAQVFREHKQVSLQEQSSWS